MLYHLSYAIEVRKQPCKHAAVMFITNIVRTRRRAQTARDATQNTLNHETWVQSSTTCTGENPSIVVSWKQDEFDLPIGVAWKVWSF